MLVHWGLEEARVLNNLGIKVPSPIEAKYMWPGLHKPFDHQRQTAAFLTLNKRAFCFSEQGCVDSDTEYLSPTGWKRISEYTTGMVAQYSPESGTVEFVTPSEYVKLPCTDMVRIKTKSGIDQLLSPEHRVLIKDGIYNRNKTETLSAEALLARHNMSQQRVPHCHSSDEIAFSAATIPTGLELSSTSSMPMTAAHLRVQVAVIADGHFGSNSPHCVIRLQKDRKKQRLRDVLRAADIPFLEEPCTPTGFSKFTFAAPLRLKHFDARFWAASPAQLRVIADEALLWAGSTARGMRYSTTSQASADFIQYVFCMTGRTARQRTYQQEGKPTEYVVRVRDTDRLFLLGSKPTITRAISTDGYKYCFKVPSTYLVFRRNGCVFASGNTGKTASAIWAADYLMNLGAVKRVLIVCPLSIMDSAWKSDLFTFAMHRTVDIAHGSSAKRRKIIAQGAEFVVINYDGINVVLDELDAGGFDLIIVDEATHYKNPSTKRWRALFKLLKTDTWLWMMTGTPAAQSPMDAFGLAKLVNPNNVPRFMSAFRDQVMHKVTQFKWVPKEDAVDTVFRVLQPAIRFTKAECLDLPDMVYTVRDVPMTRQQTKYYKKLREEMTMQAAAKDVTAANAAVMMNKLLQIACGAVYADDGDVLEFDIAHRYNVLKEVIDESSHKVLVFVPFKHSIRMLADRLANDGISTGVIQGDVPAAQRTRIFKKFQTETDPQVLVIQPQSAAHGVTLTAANTVVWWGPTSSLEIFAQANARVHRSGQSNKCTVVQLQSSAVERRLYSLLNNRIDVHSKILDLYNDIVDNKL